MKKIIVFLISLVVITSCATNKTSKAKITPAGTWDYSITGTPEGDFNGVMIVTELEKTFSAKMTSRGNELNIDNFTWDGVTTKVSGEINYTGYIVTLNATLSGDEMTGNMFVEGESFPFKANRKK